MSLKNKFQLYSKENYVKNLIKNTTDLNPTKTRVKRKSGLF